MGQAGLHDLTNNHYVRLFGNSLMFSAFAALGQLSQPQTNANTQTISQMVYASVGEQIAQTGSQLIAKNLTIQPTLTIRPGTNFNVMLTHDLGFENKYES